MTAFLRFVGILNAAVWCGSAIFVMVGVPALFAPANKAALGDWNTGLAAQAILARFFILQYWCLAIAFSHLLAEWWFFGRPLWRFTSGLLLGLAVFSLAAGLWLQPKLLELHRVKYLGTVETQRTQAAGAFKMWHGAAQGANLLVIVALVSYLTQVTRAIENRRFVTSAKNRS